MFTSKLSIPQCGTALQNRESKKITRVAGDRSEEASGVEGKQQNKASNTGKQIGGSLLSYRVTSVRRPSVFLPAWSRPRGTSKAAPQSALYSDQASTQPVVHHPNPISLPLIQLALVDRGSPDVGHRDRGEPETRS